MTVLRAGLFESQPDAGPFGSLSLDVVGSPAHHKLALEAARCVALSINPEVPQQCVPVC
jgi:hypothetical protein